MTDRVKSLSGLAIEASEHKIEAALKLACELFDMELGYFTQFVGGEQVYRGLSGDGSEFGIGTGEGMALDGSYCQRMVRGTIPNAIPDVDAKPELTSLAFTTLSDLGAYIGVPVQLADGEVFGSLCAISRDANHKIGEDEVAVMQILAGFVASEVERQMLLSEQDTLRRRIAELERGSDAGAAQERLSELLPADEIQDAG